MANRTVTKFVLLKVSGAASAAQAAAAKVAAIAAQVAASASAVIASTAATTATTQATSAAASATAAEISKNAAQAAESAMALLYDNFDDRYLGAKATPPALDNDGNAILIGALYFDTPAGEWRIWNGSAWQNAPFSIPGTLLTTNNLSDVVSAAMARVNLGLEIGSDVQAWSQTLELIAALTTTAYGRNLLTLGGAAALASGLTPTLDTRYVQPSFVPPPSAMWYAFRDAGDGRLELEYLSPFEVETRTLNDWDMRFTNGALAFGYLIAINSVTTGNAGIRYTYETTPEATVPTAIAWGLRDAGDGRLLLETINPLGGEAVPSPNWNMKYTSGMTAYGSQSLFEVSTSQLAGVVLNY